MRVREVPPHHVPEALRWDIVDFLGDPPAFCATGGDTPGHVDRPSSAGQQSGSTAATGAPSEGAK